MVVMAIEKRVKVAQAEAFSLASMTITVSSPTSTLLADGLLTSLADGLKNEPSDIAWDGVRVGVSDSTRDGVWDRIEVNGLAEGEDEG
jgi:hypothetical protein